MFHISFLHTYGVLVALAFLVALVAGRAPGARAGLKASRRQPGHLLCAGAHRGRQDHDVPDRFRAIMRNPGEIFSLATLQAGGVFYGGLIGGARGAVFYMRKTICRCWRRPMSSRPAIALGHGIGRLGCFAAGCCWGWSASCHGRSPSPIRCRTTWWACR